MSSRNDLWCKAFRNKSSPWRCPFRTGLMSSPAIGSNTCAFYLFATHQPHTGFFPRAARFPVGSMFLPFDPCSLPFPLWLELDLWDIYFHTHGENTWETIYQLKSHRQSEARGLRRLTTSPTWARQLKLPLPLEFFFRVVRPVSLFLKMCPWLSTKLRKTQRSPPRWYCQWSLRVGFPSASFGILRSYYLELNYAYWMNKWDANLSWGKEGLLCQQIQSPKKHTKNFMDNFHVLFSIRPLRTMCIIVVATDCPGSSTVPLIVYLLLLKGRARGNTFTHNPQYWPFPCKFCLWL